MAVTWENVRARKTMRKSTMLLDLNAGKTDAEIWANFNDLIDEDIVSDYMAEFCNVLCEAQVPLRLSLTAAYLPSVIPARAQELHRFTVLMCTTHNDAAGATQYIDSYVAKYGKDKAILLEELNYYNTFDPGNTTIIQELVTAIKAYGEV